MSFGFASRLAGLYVAIFMMGGVHLPFFPLWLKSTGLDAGEIGLVLAVPTMIRLLAVPLATRIADRRDTLREAILIAALVSVGGYLLLGLASGFTAIVAAFALASFAYTPVMPLVETYALKGLAARGRAYGPVRLWGSAAFIVGSFIAGFAADMLAPRYLIWLIVGGMVVIALSAATLEPVAGKSAAPRTRTPDRRLLRDPVFVSIVLSAGLIQASHATYYGFSALAWGAQGYDGKVVAALWALGVLAEIVLFALQARLPAFLTPAMLLIVGGLGGALRWSVMAFDPPVLLLPPLQLLHAASFGASHLGALMYLSRAVPAGQSATAQGYLAIALGLTMAAAMGLSGLLYEAYGVASYGAMALAAIAGSVSALVAHRSRRVAAV
jgi:PPP family 3-phenylpropionic acid transporter